MLVLYQVDVIQLEVERQGIIWANCSASEILDLDKLLKFDKDGTQWD